MNSYNKLFILIYFIGLFLIFSGLDKRYLWQDEAETAVLGWNTLMYGYPVAYDDTNLITTNGYDFAQNFLWVWHTWLSFYLEALSLLLFGKTTWGARAIFAFFGFLSLYIIKKLYEELSSNKLERITAFVLMYTNLSFFLFVRQARYYSLVIFFTSIFLLYYLKLRKTESRKNNIIFIISGILLFHTNYLTFFITIISLLFFILFVERSYKLMLIIIKNYIYMTPFTFIWLAFFIRQIFKNVFVADDFFSLIYKKYFYIIELNYTFSFLLILLLSLFAYKKTDFNLRFSVFLVTVTIALIILLPFSYSRYAVGVLPLFYLACSKFIFNFRKSWIRLLFILILSTNLLAVLPLYLLNNSIINDSIFNLCNLRYNASCFDISKKMIQNNLIFVTPLDYAFELIDYEKDPINSIVGYFSENNIQNKVIMINYDYTSLIFYSNNVLLTNTMNPKLDNNNIPDYVIVRGLKDDTISPSVNIFEDIIHELNNTYGVNKIELEAINEIFFNREVLLYHEFTYDDEKPKQILYKVNK